MAFPGSVDHAEEAAREDRGLVRGHSVVRSGRRLAAHPMRSCLGEHHGVFRIESVEPSVNAHAVCRAIGRPWRGEREGHRLRPPTTVGGHVAGVLGLDGGLSRRRGGQRTARGRFRDRERRRRERRSALGRSEDLRGVGPAGNVNDRGRVERLKVERFRRVSLRICLAVDRFRGRFREPFSRPPGVKADVRCQKFVPSLRKARRLGGIGSM